MDVGSARRNRWVQVGLLAIGSVIAFWAGVSAFVQDDDGTDSGGMLGLSLVALAAMSFVGALAVVAQEPIRRFFGGKARTPPADPR